MGDIALFSSCLDLYLNWKDFIFVRLLLISNLSLKLKSVLDFCCYFDFREWCWTKVWIFSTKVLCSCAALLERSPVESTYGNPSRKCNSDCKIGFIIHHCWEMSTHVFFSLSVSCDVLHKVFLKRVVRNHADVLLFTLSLAYDYACT